MKYEIGNKKFKSKKDAEVYIRNIVDTIYYFDELSTDDFDFLMELFKNHHDYAKKIGCGVAKITVEPTEKGTKGFFITRLDGKKEDISWTTCLKDINKQVNPNNMFREACRKAIEPQIDEFRKTQRIEGKYKHINGTFYDRKDIHVDHEKYFEDIVKEFMEQWNGDINKVEYEHGIGVSFKNEELKKEFADYHKKHATLRILTKEENLKRGYHKEV